MCATIRGLMFLLIIMILDVVSPSPNLAGEQRREQAKLFTYLDSEFELTPKQASILQRLRKEKSTEQSWVIRVNTELFPRGRVVCNIKRKIEVVFERCEMNYHKDRSFVWTGQRHGRPQEAHFFVKQGNVMGEFPYGRFIYNIRPLGAGVHVLLKRNPKKVPNDEPPVIK